MRAEIITIGTELLLGEIVDTNTAAIASTLRELGLDLFRSTTVGDNASRICAAVEESLARAEIVITSGGLGPTVDDATRDGVSRAFSLELEFREELWDQIQARFARFGAVPTENNRRQAHVPKGSIAIENPVGTAPAFILERDAGALISLPGVPSELEFLLENAVSPYLRERFGLGEVIHTRILRTAGVGESWLDNQIQDLEKLENPTVGLAAHPGSVDIRITAKASSQAAAEELIAPVESDLLGRLGDVVYGFDDDSLEGVIGEALLGREMRLLTVESGTPGYVAAGLADLSDSFAAGIVLPQAQDPQELEEILSRGMQEYQAQVGLMVALRPGEEKQSILILLHQTGDTERIERPYGGPPEHAPAWARSIALNLLRRRFMAD
jgi:competence/damage-inducible protein CinA-like protein